MKVRHARDDNRIENSRRKPGKIWVIGARSDSYRAVTSSFRSGGSASLFVAFFRRGVLSSSRTGIACNGSGRVSLRRKPGEA